MNLYYNLYCAIKMADFKCQQFEIGLEFTCRSSAECDIFSEGSSEPTKDTKVIQVQGEAAPGVFELELLVLLVIPTLFFPCFCLSSLHPFSSHVGHVHLSY